MAGAQMANCPKSRQALYNAAESELMSKDYLGAAATYLEMWQELAKQLSSGWPPPSTSTVRLLVVLLPEPNSALRRVQEISSLSWSLPWRDWTM